MFLLDWSYTTKSCFRIDKLLEIHAFTTTWWPFGDHLVTTWWPPGEVIWEEYKKCENWKYTNTKIKRAQIQKLENKNVE